MTINSRSGLTINPAYGSEPSDPMANDPRFKNLMPDPGREQNLLDTRVLSGGGGSITMFDNSGTDQGLIERQYHAIQEAIISDLDEMTGEPIPGREHAVAAARTRLAQLNASYEYQRVMDERRAAEAAERKEQEDAGVHVQNFLQQAGSALRAVNEQRRQAGLQPVDNLRDHMADLEALSKLLGN